MYQAQLHLPFGTLGIIAPADVVMRIDFLPPEEPERAPQTGVAAAAANEILRYLADPEYPMAVPHALVGTPFQQRVWAAISRIPPGKVRRYGEVARELQSAARAVGGACGANPLPLLVPCHRVVAQAGLGGFNGNGSPSLIKTWLLHHEGIL